MLNQSITFGDLRLPAHFWSKVRVLNNGCWEWTAVRDGNGYGRFAVGRREPRRTTHAPRLAYETLVGAIPDGFEPDHLCRNRACVWPQHLEPVVRAVNVHRGLLSKLTETDVRIIRDLRGRLTQRHIAAWFGVSRSNIGYIQRGDTWRTPSDEGRTRVMDEKPEYWVCIVGPVTRSQLQDGADAPPRGAVQRAVADMTDEWPERCWSGWGCTEEVKDKILEAWS